MSEPDPKAEEVRRAWVQMLVDGGLSRADAMLVYDMANHASNQAFEAITRVARSSHNGHYLQTVTTALAIIESKTAIFAEQMNAYYGENNG